MLNLNISIYILPDFGSLNAYSSSHNANSHLTATLLIGSPIIFVFESPAANHHISNMATATQIKYSNATSHIGNPPSTLVVCTIVSKKLNQLTTGFVLVSTSCTCDVLQ